MKIEPKLKCMSLRDKLNMSSTTKIIINGHEMTIAEYMQDPKYYNSLPMKKAYIQEIIEDCEKAKDEKEKLMDLKHYDKTE
jgi:hypothetical protein